MRYILLISVVLLSFPTICAQRTYKPHSVLASGNWYKLSVKSPGIYKVDIPFLSALGINTSGLQSNSIRMYGNGGYMLPENNAEPRTDDLSEIALWIVDGGDGNFNGSDYFLFFSNGPEEWVKDSANQTFHHRKNLYSDKSYYFLTIGGPGKRIQTASGIAGANIVVTSFQDRYFYETDRINFLSSGKEWYGEEFSDIPGNALSRTFNVDFPNLLQGQTAVFRSNVLSRSAGNPSRFDIRINNNLVLQQNISPVGTGFYDPIGIPSSEQTVFQPNASQLQVAYTFQPGSVNAQGWLNWFEILPVRSLSLNGPTQLMFRDWSSLGQNNIAEFRIQNAAANTSVWDVTDPSNPVKMFGALSASEYIFNNTAERLREYIAFTGNNFLQPAAEGNVVNQDLHNSAVSDYIVVAYPDFVTEAQRLASQHQQREGFRTIVATTQQIFNEFSSGSPDPAAIRDFVKMYYDKAGGDTLKQPRYLLLFGNGSYDYRDRISPNYNFVPAFESDVSIDPLGTYTSDDFYGFLDDNENIGISFPVNLLDIGIGRIPAKTVSEAKNAVDKVIHYARKESLGPWRNELTFVADDEDNNLHLQDAEAITNTVNNIGPVFNRNKFYLDAYRQQSGSGGSRYPDVNNAINSKIFSGNLIWNYNGHGGSKRLAEEDILDQDMINTWNNPDKLPLFITATCDFAPYDNPTANSIGENILLREKTGGIALMTTTRVVFAFSNRVMNNNYLQFALQRKYNGQYPSLGEAVKQAKNYTYSFFSDVINNRKFALLGDPGLTIGYPLLKVKTTAINNKPVGADTLKALNQYAVNGMITDMNDNPVTDFNGTVYSVIYDKEQTIQTLGNDAGSDVVGFKTRQNVLYKGKAKVTNGTFSFAFIVPKDINYQFGNGKISYYAEDGIRDGNGYESSVIIGGAGDTSLTDNSGPVLKAYLNDEKFVSGGISNETPVLLVKLYDSSGINTVGTGIGHDIVATLDNDNNRFFILNDYYEAATGSFREGSIQFQLPRLEPGPHSIKIKAWDIANNSGEAALEFTVIKEDQFRIEHVLNYPNPFTTHTAFWFEHNRPGDNLSVNLRIFTIAGRLVKTLSQTIINTGNRSCELEWDGRDEYGQKLGRGVYLYLIEVKDGKGAKQKKIEKLVIL